MLNKDIFYFCNEKDTMILFFYCKIALFRCDIICLNADMDKFYFEMSTPTMLRHFCPFTERLTSFFSTARERREKRYETEKTQIILLLLQS